MGSKAPQSREQYLLEKRLADNFREWMSYYWPVVVFYVLFFAALVFGIGVCVGS